MNLLYFAWVRQRIGRGEEEMTLPADVKTLSDLAAHLHARGGGYAEAFGDVSRLRAAINQEHVHWDAPVRADDEIAFFPPVTGG